MTDTLMGILFAVVAVAMLAGSAWGQPWRFDDVTVVGCYDGDTCTVTLPGVHPLFGREARVRLLGVDAPELSGACAVERKLARRARAVTRGAVLDAERVDVVDVEQLDVWGRILGRLVADGVDVGRGLVVAGLARVVRGREQAVWC